jgi:hypothetical protein
MKLFSLLASLAIFSVTAFGAVSKPSFAQQDDVMQRVVDVYWRNASFDEVLDWLNELNINYFIDSRIVARQQEIVERVGNSTTTSTPPFITLKAEKVKVGVVLQMIGRACGGAWGREGDIYTLEIISHHIIDPSAVEVPATATDGEPARIAPAAMPQTAVAISDREIARSSHAADLLLTDTQWQTFASRGYLKTSELSKSQRSRLVKWFNSTKKGDIGVFWSSQGRFVLHRN